jgi:hypothetical protein
MDTRRFRQHSPAEVFAAFRWLGWVMLMMFVLVQAARAAAGGSNAQADATGPMTRELSQASAQLDSGTHQVTMEAPRPPTYGMPRPISALTASSSTKETFTNRSSLQSPN